MTSRATYLLYRRFLISKVVPRYLYKLNLRLSHQPHSIHNMSGAMQSNVGNPQVYNDGDQKTSKGEFVPPRFEAGQPNSHQQLDSTDQRSIANKLAAAEKAEKDERKNSDHSIDPREPALSHGNKPSRGAEVDAMLQAEDAQTLQNKGRA